MLEKSCLDIEATQTPCHAEKRIYWYDIFTFSFIITMQHQHKHIDAILTCLMYVSVSCWVIKGS